MSTMNHLQYPDITSQVGLQENHFSSQTDPFTTRLHFQSSNIADKLGHSIIPQVMNETCRYQLNTTLQNFDSMMRYNSIYINTAKNDAATNVECFKDAATSHTADKKSCASFSSHLLDAKTLPKNYQKSANDGVKFASAICAAAASKSNGISAIVSSAGKSKFMIDVATMTDPLTPEEQERLCQWEGFAAVQSGNKVAEYLTGLREFLKVPATTRMEIKNGLVRATARVQQIILYLPFCTVKNVRNMPEQGFIKFVLFSCCSYSTTDNVAWFTLRKVEGKCKGLVTFEKV